MSDTDFPSDGQGASPAKVGGMTFVSAPSNLIELEPAASCSAGKQSLLPRRTTASSRSRRGRLVIAAVGVLVFLVALAGLISHTRGTSLPQLLAPKAVEPTEIRGTFRFAGEGGDIEAEYVYTDAYFDQSASSYNSSLATSSCSLALAAGGTYEKGRAASANAVEMLEALGFTDVRANDAYEEEPTPTSIGVILGHKELAGSNRHLLVVAVRGGGYGAEWASNMQVGAESEHAGFAAARTKVLRFIRAYERTTGISPEAMWVVGYSRGGGVAGLVAQSLVDDGALTPDALYAYAFEPPASVRTESGVSTSASTQNASPAQAIQAHVWNLVNPADLVPRVPLAQWGFTHPGHIVELPEVGTAGYGAVEAKMRTQLVKIGGNDTYGDVDFAAKKMKATGEIVDSGEDLTQAQFLDELTAWIAGDGEKHLLDFSVPSAETYAIELQDGLTYLAELFSTESPEVMAEVQEAVWQDIIDNPLTYARSGIAGVTGFGGYDELADAYATAMDKAGVSYERARLDEAVEEIAGFLLRFAIGNPNGLATLLGNVPPLVEAHSGVVELAWMQAADPNFTDSPIEFVVK